MNSSDGQTEILEMQLSLKRTHTFTYPNLLGLHNVQLQMILGRQRPLMTLSALHVKTKPTDAGNARG